MTSEIVKLRKSTSTDNVLVSNIIKSNSALYDSIMPGAFIRYSKKLLTTGMPKDYVVEVISLNDIDVGFIGTKRLEKDIIYLVAIYLDQQYIGKKIGSKVINLLIEKYCSSRISEILLMVHTKADWAKKFYKHNGFINIAIGEEDISAYREGVVKNLYLSNTELYKLTINQD